MYQKGGMGAELAPVTVNDPFVHVSTRLRQVYSGCASTPHSVEAKRNVESIVSSGSRRNMRCPALIESATLSSVSTGYVRDVAAVCGTVVASFGFVTGVKLLENRGYVHKNLSRKIVHSLAGPLFVLCWPLFGSLYISRYIAMVVPMLNGLSLFLAGTSAVPDRRAVSAISRTGDPKELLRGPLYYTIALSIVTACLWRESMVAVAVVSVMCGGDGLADIIGRAFGQQSRLPWNKSKSWPGSLAMFVGGLGTSLLLAYYLAAFGYLQVDSASVTGLAVVAAAATVVESLPINKVLDDNISVPLAVTYLGMHLL